MQCHLGDAACLKAVRLLRVFEAVLAFVLGKFCYVSVSFVKSSVQMFLCVTLHYIEAFSFTSPLKTRSDLSTIFSSYRAVNIPALCKGKKFNLM